MFALSKGVVPVVVVIVFSMKQIVAVKYMICVGAWLNNTLKAVRLCGQFTATTKTTVRFNAPIKSVHANATRVSVIRLLSNALPVTDEPIMWGMKSGKAPAKRPSTMVTWKAPMKKLTTF